ncbi:MAG: type II toxin-antitoxin system VapC family toxin [Candidatus Poribacteria bacterium]|nr:type II toxin-antitoxin system VapC family toxin [Candidatus Poribacteria bacterium]
MADKIVFDASVSAKWVLDEAMTDTARALLDECERDDIEITVPPLWEYELDSIIRHHVYRGEVTVERAKEIRVVLASIPVTVKYSPLIRSRANEIAATANQRRVYDIIYAAHAEAEECDLWTADNNYFKAVRAFLTNVKYLSDYFPTDDEKS